MITLELLRWWYGRGWQLMCVQAGRRLTNLANAFSVGTLLRTLFAPWRRIVSYPGAALDDKLRAMLDNLVSRGVGFAVRILVLIAVAVLTVVIIAVDIIQIIAWPLVPLMIIAGIILGVR